MNPQLKTDIDKLYEKTDLLVYEMIRKQLENDYVGQKLTPALRHSMSSDINYYFSDQRHIGLDVSSLFELYDF